MENILMDYMKAKALLNDYSIRSVDSTYVNSAQEAINFSKKKPIVLKVLTQKALHKSKSGLVELNLKDDVSISNAYHKLVKKSLGYKPYKILAQHMVDYKSDNIEIIIGGRNDPQFGQLVLIGLGGIYVETFKDFTLRVCPINKKDAFSMIDELKSGHIIAKDKKNRDMIAEILTNVSKLMINNKINELDLNPLILHDNTYSAVDLRLLI